MNETPNGTEQDNESVYSIEKIYVKNFSVEVPEAPSIYLETETPEVDLEIGVESQELGNDFYEVQINLTLTALLADKRPVFFVEAAQAGIFRVANVPEDSMKPLLMIGCPNVLFPYLRELVSNGVSRAGFQQQVLLAPVDFEAMYLNNENVA